MRRTLIAVSCLVLVGLAAQACQRGIITGQFVPDGLMNAVAGTPYRLIFVTAGTTAGTSADKLHYYDPFVQQQAAENSVLANNGIYRWKALAHSRRL